MESPLYSPPPSNLVCHWPSQLGEKVKPLPTNRTASKIRLLRNILNVFLWFAFFTSANERYNKMRGLEPRTRRPDTIHDIAAVFSSTLPQEDTSFSCLAVGTGERSWIRNGSSRTVPTRRSLPLHPYYPLRRQRLLRLLSSSASFRSWAYLC